MSHNLSENFKNNQTSINPIIVENRNVIVGKFIRPIAEKFEYISISTTDVIIEAISDCFQIEIISDNIKITNSRLQLVTMVIKPR
jgi:hypothetical protein